MTHKDLMLLVDDYASAYKNNLVLHPSVGQARAQLFDALKQVVQDAELGRTAMRFVDRAGDVAECDPAERICAEFNKAMWQTLDAALSLIHI